MSVPPSALRMGHNTSDCCHFHSQFIRQIRGTEFFIEVINNFNASPINIFYSLNPFPFPLFSIHRKHFFSGNKLKMSILSRKNESVCMIKFIGRLHLLLLNIIDQFNYCYSFQVCRALHFCLWEI